MRSAIALRGYVNVRKHDPCDAISGAFRHFPLLGNVQNPLDKYMSQFEFNWFMTHPPSK